MRAIVETLLIADPLGLLVGGCNEGNAYERGARWWYDHWYRMWHIKVGSSIEEDVCFHNLLKHTDLILFFFFLFLRSTNAVLIECCTSTVQLKVLDDCIA